VDPDGDTAAPVLPPPPTMVVVPPVGPVVLVLPALPVGPVVDGSGPVAGPLVEGPAPVGALPDPDAPGTAAGFIHCQAPTAMTRTAAPAAMTAMFRRFGAADPADGTGAGPVPGDVCRNDELSAGAVAVTVGGGAVPGAVPAAADVLGARGSSPWAQSLCTAGGPPAAGRVEGS
jgi:hypothetical protein